MNCPLRVILGRDKHDLFFIFMQGLTRLLNKQQSKQLKYFKATVRWLDGKLRYSTNQETGLIKEYKFSYQVVVFGWWVLKNIKIFKTRSRKLRGTNWKVVVLWALSLRHKPIRVSKLSEKRNLCYVGSSRPNPVKRTSLGSDA